MAEVVVKGLSELQVFLDQLAPKLEANIMRQALRAGCKPILEEAKRNVPIGIPNPENMKLYGGYEGALRDSLHISSKIKGSTGKVTASVVCGGKNSKTGADVFYAHMIEFTGAVAHEIRPQHGRSLFIAGLFGTIVHHPGFRAHPFMRPALDSQAQNAVIAAGEYIKNRLATKEGLDTAGILVEGDE